MIFKETFVLLVLLLVWIQYVVALPKFNTINGNYYNGTTCPPATKKNTACPTLCVRDQLECPTRYGPSACTQGLTLCSDGSCQPFCTSQQDANNKCASCPAKPGLSLKSCFTDTPLYVEIPNYQPNNATLQLYETCSKEIGFANSIVSTWSGDITPIWNVCGAPEGMNFPTNTVTVIVVLAVYLAFFPLWALWIAYKYVKEKKYKNSILSTSTNNTTIIINVHNNSSSSSSSDNNSQFSNEEKELKLVEYEKGSPSSPTHPQETKGQEPEEIVYQKGFKNNVLGMCMLFYVGLISLFWIVILLILCLDYYGYVVIGVPFGLFFNSYDLSSKVFCLVWFFSTSWYLTINLSRSKIQNHFRILTSFDKADHIQIEKERKVIHMMNTNEGPHRLKVIENATRHLLGFDKLVKTVPVMENKQHRYFEFQSTRYTLSEHLFEPAQVDMSTDKNTLVAMEHGLDSETARQRLETLGPNFIQVIVPSFFKAFWEELTGFFYIYQLQILWCYFYLAYWQIGLTDTLVILLAALIKVYVRLKSENRVKKMAEHVDTCQVYRDKEWVQLSTADLVPGDIIHIIPNQIIPMDGVILQGDIVVDESSLTGEPLPIRKFPLRPQAVHEQKEAFDPQGDGKINSLFAGTTIKQVTKENGKMPIALVLKTRTNTDKGQLVQRILFPQPISFIFNEQLKLVFCLLLLWAIVLLGFGAWLLGGTGMTAWFYGTICAAQVMNPLLPAILVVGQSIAAGRLKKKGVFCVDLPRILMAGKVQIFCFDKTGTLTNEGLEYYGVYPITQFDKLHETFDDLSSEKEEEIHKLLQIGLSSCHSVTTLQDDYVGNPVDIVMFQSTGAKLLAANKEGHDIISTRHGDLEILQRFEFQHARASMSIAVKDTTTGETHVFCKGSFERIAETCPDSLPPQFDEQTSNSAKSGCYVLAMAHRNLGILSKEEEERIRTDMTRDQLETGLTFIGLVLFKNLLKSDTTAAIHQIRQGDVRTVMITGDNALTGVFIGQQCGLVPETSTMLLGDINDEQQGGKHIVWSDIQTGTVIKDIDLTLASDSSVELAMTGKAFRWLVDHDKIRQYIFITRVFARMTPVDKMQCVEFMMEKAIVAMCGDGGNDCGALKSAHVGIAMSEAEASVVSPFSTPNRSVQACVDLLIQGRSALATSFASYKYLIMYGETMATVKFLAFYFTLSFSQWNYIFVDAFITVFCSFAVTQAGAAKRLSMHRPTARILGPEVLLSVLGQIVINVCFLASSIAWLYTKDDFFRCNEWDARATDGSKWWLLGDSFEADVITFIALFQFVNAALIFNYGYIFRQRWYKNYFLIFVWSLFVAIVSYWELADPNSFGCLVRVNCGNPDVLESLGYPRPNFYIEPYNNPLGHNVLPRYFRWQLWGYSIANMVAVHIWERFVILGPVRQWTRKRYPLNRFHVNL